MLVLLVNGCSNTFNLELDKNDYITYETGGRARRALDANNVFGDGSVKYRYFEAQKGDRVRGETTQDYRLSKEHTRKLFQLLVDMGILDMESKIVRGADLPTTTIIARVDNRDHRVSWNLITEADKKYTMLNQFINKTLSDLGVKRR